MKNQTIFQVFMAASIACLTFGMYSCGGGSSEPFKADNAVKKEDASKTAASPNGIGRFADKQIAAFDATSAKEGKVLFESKCSACHRLTDEKIVGPGLKSVTSRRNANWILNMITNPIEMTQKDPVAKELYATHLTQMTNQNVDDDAALKMLNYLRENDGVK